MSPELVFNFDRTEYIPGEIVKISGIIENAYYYDNISILVETPDISTINCLVGQQCGSGNSEKDVRVHEGVEGPQFFMNYRIISHNSFVRRFSNFFSLSLPPPIMTQSFPFKLRYTG